MTDEAFARELEALRPKMLRYARKLERGEEVSDLIQDAMVKAWKCRHTFDGTRAKLSTWLMVVLRGVAFDRTRYQKIRRSWQYEQLDDLDLTLTPDKAQDFERGTIALLDLERAARRRNTLTDSEREGLYLAATTPTQGWGVPKEGRVHVFRARAKLRKAA